MSVTSFESISLSECTSLGASGCAHLVELDRAGWAWEWLRRNSEFAKLQAASGPSPLRTGAVRLDETLERSLLGWGLHYG